MSKQAQVSIAPTVIRRGVSSKRLREALDAYGMLLPTILGVLVFFAVPLAISLYLSFTDSQLFGTPSIIGIRNYTDVLRDPEFYRAMGSTLIFSVISLFATTVPALLLALLLNSKIRGQNFFRAAFFIPVVASVVGVSLIWRFLLDVDIGFINYGLSLIGIRPGVPWLVSPNVGLISVMLVFAWKTIGYNMVIFLAGLQSVSRQLYEAASIDGANRWQKFWSITVPVLSPTTFFILVTTLINCLQIFDIPYALGATRGAAVGPADSMLTVVVYLFRKGFGELQMGYASSIAWILFLMIMVITFVQFRMSARWVNYE